MNYADIDFIEVLLNPQHYSKSEVERALEIDCKSRVAWREMLENVEETISEENKNEIENSTDIDFVIDTLKSPTYNKVSKNDYVKKQDVIDLCYMLQDKISKQGQVLIEQIISAVEDMKPE